jgi:DNA repair photolyase
MKNFYGKCIYNPSGKAGEYSYWAANFYNGCSARCTYCYNRHGRNSKVVGGDTPILKKSLQGKRTPLSIFQGELLYNAPEIRKHGLFLNFVSDPCLYETIALNFAAIESCNQLDIPVKILTKQAWWIGNLTKCFHNVIYGFSLTGFDLLEPGASKNFERIESIIKLHRAGFKTMASIEPVIKISKSLEMIDSIREHIDLIKIGLLAGIHFNKQELRMMLTIVNGYADLYNFKIYWKDTFLKQAGINRADLPSNCVTRNFNL